MVNSEKVSLIPRITNTRASNIKVIGMNLEKPIAMIASGISNRDNAFRLDCLDL